MSGFDARALLAFGGLLFFFMGLGLSLDPESYARAAAHWPSAAGGQAEEVRALTRRLCRLCGIVFFAAAAWLFAALAGLPLELVERLSSLRFSPATALAAGGSATLLSLLMGAIKTAEWASPSRPGARARLAFWSGWAVMLTLLAFGAFLLSRARML